MLVVVWWLDSSARSKVGAWNARRLVVLTGRNIKEDTPMVANPENPTQEEIEKHELTHANYKGWCKFCKMGLARRDAHRRHTKRTRSL